jgi:hypothetical protein
MALASSVDCFSSVTKKALRQQSAEPFIQLIFCAILFDLHFLCWSLMAPNFSIRFMGALVVVCIARYRQYNTNKTFA